MSKYANRATPESRGRIKLHPMQMLTHEETKKEMELAGLTPAVRVDRTDIVLIAKEITRRRRAVTWPHFFSILDERKLAVFIDPITGYMKIMGKKNLKV